MAIGGIAQMILGTKGRDVDWGMALGAGIAGSFVGGIVMSFLFGDGLKLAPTGLVGSLLGALVVTVAWQLAGRADR